MWMRHSSRTGRPFFTDLWLCLRAYREFLERYIRCLEEQPLKILERTVDRTVERKAERTVERTADALNAAAKLG